MTVYTPPGQGAATNSSRRVPSAARGVIFEAKERVAAVELAERLTGDLRTVGERLVGRCPLPNHEDRTPSFTLYPKSDSWYCYGCSRGGDVIDLAQHAWKIDRADVAAAELLITFGYDVPQRPPSWFRKQERQKEPRNLIEEAKLQSVRRRVFREILLPFIDGVEDPDTRLAEEEVLWRDALRIARAIRVGRGLA